jgi:hypothetical protein
VTATGTVYALIDPRDGEPRYIGQTKKQPFTARLAGGYAPRVHAWMAEVRKAGLKPQIVAVREGVPVDDLLAAEAEEIMRVIVAGGTLLNEQVTALGRKLLDERRKAEREAADRAAWAEVADAALAVLGGPLSPGDLPLVEIPDVSWHFMSTGGPARVEHANSLLRSVSWREVPSEHHALQQAAAEEQGYALEGMLCPAQYAWENARRAGGDSFDRFIERNIRTVLDARCVSREDASRFLALTAWYTVAVHPWRHLAELAQLPLDDASFTAWAGQEDGARDALAFLAAGGDGMLERLSIREHCPQRWKEPGRLLAAVAVAYSGAEPPEVIHAGLKATLGDLADDHMLTQPMADLLLRLNPRALDDIFGEDIAAVLDRDLALAEGTSGRVLRALIDRIGHVHDRKVRRVADRSAQAFPVTALPDYGGWSGPGIPVMRSVSGCLVRAGLAEPDGMTPGEYLSYIRALWTPDLERLKRLAA